MRRILHLIMMIGALAMAVPIQGRAADIEAGRRKAEVCMPCHGENGNSTIPTVPSLAGQQPLYLYYQLIQFREERRKDPQMSPFAANLSDADMQDLAAYFAAQKPVVSQSGAPDAQKVAAGKRASEVHHCASCHAPGLVGQDHIPRLAGQHHAYLLKQLRGFKAQTSTDIDGSMTEAAQALSDEEIEALAYYIAHLQPTPDTQPTR
jgi:cytochrome c553